MNLQGPCLLLLSKSFETQHCRCHRQCLNVACARSLSTAVWGQTPTSGCDLPLATVDTSGFDACLLADPEKRVPTLATQEQVNTTSFLSFGCTVSFFLTCVQVHIQQRMFVLCVYLCVSALSRVSDETQREQHSIARSAALVIKCLAGCCP